MQHRDPAVAVPELDELDAPIPYRPTPTVLGVPLSRGVIVALDTLDGALVIARRERPGLELDQLVLELRAGQARAVGA